MKQLWPETQLQQAVIEWIGYTYPKAKEMTFASAGGLVTTQKSARLLKTMGYQAGTPDIFIAIPVSPYAGLWIELKAESSTQKKGTSRQQEVLKRLRLYGYRAELCIGIDAVIQVIQDYFYGYFSKRR